MKYLVVSDIHGSGYYINSFVDIYNKEKPDKVILLGDLYYHGPRNPLTKEYNPMLVCNTLNNYKDKIICIKGNCDALVDETISVFKFEDFVKMEIAGKRFFFTHGHVYNIDNVPNDVDVLVYGHFHMGFIKEKDNVLFVNAGSISLPKNDTKNSYLLILENKIILKDVLGNIIDERNF